MTDAALGLHAGLGLLEGRKRDRLEDLCAGHAELAHGDRLVERALAHPEDDVRPLESCGRRFLYKRP